MIANNNTLIIVPTLNEGDNIQPIYRRIKNVAKEKHILFVDDNSRDGTVDNIETIIKNDSTVSLLKRNIKRGLASAYIDGFVWGMEKGYLWFQQMDADMSHDPIYLSEIEKYKTYYDVIIASRYIENEENAKWAILRKTLSYLGCFYLRVLLTVKIRDLTGGFNCYHRKVIEKILGSNIISHGFVFQAEFKYIAAINNFRIVEFPYIFKKRIKGKSKINWRIIAEALYKPFLIRILHRRKAIK